MNELTCDQVRDQIPDCIYGEASEAVERHLSTCPACREELAATRRALAVVDRVGLDAAPEGIAEAVAAGVAARLVRPRRRIGLVASLAAGLAMAAGGTWLLLRAPGDTGRQENQVLAAEASAVEADAENVLRMLDDLERENDALMRLLSQGDGERGARS